MFKTKYELLKFSEIAQPIEDSPSRVNVVSIEEDVRSRLKLPIIISPHQKFKDMLSFLNLRDEEQDYDCSIDIIVTENEGIYTVDTTDILDGEGEYKVDMENVDGLDFVKTYDFKKIE